MVHAFCLRGILLIWDFLVRTNRRVFLFLFFFFSFFRSGCKILSVQFHGPEKGKEELTKLWQHFPDLSVYLLLFYWDHSTEYSYA